MKTPTGQSSIASFLSIRTKKLSPPKRLNSPTNQTGSPDQKKNTVESPSNRPEVTSNEPSPMIITPQRDKKLQSLAIQIQAPTPDTQHQDPSDQPQSKGLNTEKDEDAVMAEDLGDIATAKDSVNSTAEETTTSSPTIPSEDKGDKEDTPSKTQDGKESPSQDFNVEDTGDQSQADLTNDKESPPTQETTPRNQSEGNNDGDKAMDIDPPEDLKDTDTSNQSPPDPNKDTDDFRIQETTYTNQSSKNKEQDTVVNEGTQSPSSILKSTFFYDNT